MYATHPLVRVRKLSMYSRERPLLGRILSAPPGTCCVEAHVTHVSDTIFTFSPPTPLPPPSLSCLLGGADLVAAEVSLLDPVDLLVEIEHNVGSVRDLQPAFEGNARVFQGLPGRTTVGRDAENKHKNGFPQYADRLT